MLTLKLLLTVAGALMMAAALGIPLYGLWKRIEYARRKSAGDESVPQPEPLSWRTSVLLVIAGCLPMLIAASIVVVPTGMGGVRTSQIRGTEPGTLYPGLHFVEPLIESVEIFDLRDHLFTASSIAKGIKAPPEPTGLMVQSREGLSIGLGITVRYRLDPNKLASVQAHLPQPADMQLVPPVVASAWRELTPNYTVREIFATKREEIREQAAAIITKKLGADGIVVEEVMLSDIDLPPEYAEGLQSLLLKEQQDDRMAVDTDIQAKQVRIAELQAEAEAAQKVKQAEGDARARVVEAKGEADAMQYTLPLKEKQIEQSKLEAEARKEATIQDAEANAQAKLIDSKAEEQRRDLLAQAEARRVKLLAEAEAVKMSDEASLLNKSPLLIDKIIAEKLSDKIQLVMVPSNGKYFFADDVFKGFAAGSSSAQPMNGTPNPASKDGN
jgi:regulator of protease activity HflC (stomatin/prohibitin superfamily)